MTIPSDEIERLIVTRIKRNTGRSREALARAILESLWEAGYDVTRRPDLIPIVRNPGEDAAPPYTAE